MNWTPEQKKAIDTVGSNILLSAAAGSGKTTVLVGRVLALLQQTDTSLDRMLIVTFTRAAASDMRAKLAARLRELAETDARMREQELKLEQASISTLHGFCAEFLRSHFEIAGVDPAFAILDDTIGERLLDEAVTEILEEAYESDYPAMKALEAGRSVSILTDLVRKLYTVLATRPDPEAWLAQTLSEQQFPLILDRLYRNTLNDVEEALRINAQALAHPGCVSHDFLQAERELLLALRDCPDLSSLQRAMADMPFKTFTQRGADPDARDEIKALRNAYKKLIHENAILKLPADRAMLDLRDQLPLLTTLGRLALAVTERFDRKKAERSALTFDDLERCTLRALQDDSVARELQQRFDHVFVDEYQDTSAIQDAIISRLSRPGSRFMVGDVKQSIYRFRNAEPKLFLDKYAHYQAEDGGTLLALTRNFRSQPAVIDFVNLIFERAMAPGCSDILYDENARLNAGLPENGNGAVELHLLTDDDAELPEELAELNATQRQAMFIARRIKALRSQDPTLRWSDFVILTRAKRQAFTDMLPTLLAEGVPAYADGATGFFDSPEIMWLVAALRLTANRLNDPELIGLLRSPVVGLDPNELALIRISYPHMSFSEAAWACAYGTTLSGTTAEPRTLPDTTVRKLRGFFDLLSAWRLRAGSTDLGELCRTVLDESGFYTYAGALPGGAQRRANLDRFVSDAARFDSDVSGSLIRFLAYTDHRMSDPAKDADIAHLLGENDDVVRLMTIHKSKGLEFRVVFAARLEKKYNLTNRDGFDWSQSLGFGIRHFDPELRTLRTTALQKAIRMETRSEEIEEEKRLLYVLLTRAKEKLVLVGSLKKELEAQMASWRSLVGRFSACLSHLDVIMAARCGAELDSVPLASELIVHTADELIAEPHEQTAENAVFASVLQDPQRYADPELEAMVAWTYPDTLSGQKPLKLTVTGLLREMEGPLVLPSLTERPAFLQEEGIKRMTGTERGTAYHRAMQLLDPSASDTEQAIALQLDRFTEQRLMTPVQREAVEPAVLLRFLLSDTGRRMRAAETLHREWSFTVMLRAGEVLTPEEAGRFADTDIMVQGTIDCCFLENGRWILLDYKTDRLNDEDALVAHYRSQLDIYALALQRITGIPTAQRLLCLLGSGRTIEV